MSENVSKMLVLPQDGSEFAIKSIYYLNLMFGPTHNMDVVLFYILPSVPSAMRNAGQNNDKTAGHLKTVSQRNEALADEILGTAKDVLLGYNFLPERIKTVCKGCEQDIAKDIVDWSHKKTADGILLNCHGRSRVEAFFMGEVSLKMLECSGSCPVMLLRGDVTKKDVLIAVDNSENALRAVDYAGFMLNGTDSRIILFHTKKSLRRFLPKSIFEDIPGFSELWAEKSEEEIVPTMEKAKTMLIKAGIEEDRIRAETFDGSRSPAKDILAAADEYGCGTVVVGRQGESGHTGFALGAIARKLIDATNDMAIWVI